MRLLLEAGGPRAGTTIALLILFCAFLAGAAAAVLLLLRAATAAEGSDLRVRPPSRAAAAGRRLTGLQIRDLAAPAGSEGGRR